MNKPISVNFHINRACNFRCRFCYAPFHDVPGQLSVDQARQIIGLLAAAGTQKINFAGGEPTLHPGLPDLLQHAHAQGMVTTIVTNGARLGVLLRTHAHHLGWVGLSVDSVHEATQQRLGRGGGQHIANVEALCAQARALGLKIKINTVVTRATWQEDMSPLIRRTRPERWKVFQALPIQGQNDGRIEPLLITPQQFDAFVGRHAHLAAEGLAPIPESNQAMRGSYIMIDPAGRFFSNATGRHVYSDPILDIGVQAALAQVRFDADKFLARGGHYAWGAPASPTSPRQDPS